MDLVFTDLDGTLLDRETYAWEPARPALERLKRRGVPWIPVTSKTRAEVEIWRRRLGNLHPFIVENGGAAFVPSGYFGSRVPGSQTRGPYEVLEWGTPYRLLVEALDAAARASGCGVRGFHAMPAEEVAALSGLPLDQAALAKQREYDEPFVVLDPERAGALAGTIGERGLRWTRGGRFWHILGANDKALAVTALTGLFARGREIPRTIGLGDGLNDASFLNVVAVPVLIRSPQIEELKALVAHGMVTGSPGPAGWNDAILELVPG